MKYATSSLFTGKIKYPTLTENALLQLERIRTYSPKEPQGFSWHLLSCGLEIKDAPYSAAKGHSVDLHDDDVGEINEKLEELIAVARGNLQIPQDEERVEVAVKLDESLSICVTKYADGKLEAGITILESESTDVWSIAISMETLIELWKQLKEG